MVNLMLKKRLEESFKFIRCFSIDGIQQGIENAQVGIECFIIPALETVRSDEESQSCENDS